MTQNDPAPGEGGRAGDAAATQYVTRQSTAGTDGPARLLSPLAAYVTGGRDRPALDRLRTAADHGRELVHRGARITDVAFHLILAAELVGVGRPDAEAVLRLALAGRR